MHIQNIFKVCVASLSLVACGVDAGSGSDESAISTVKPVLMGVDMSGEAEFAKATGLKAQVIRAYLKQGDSIPASVTAAHLDGYYAAGQSVVYSIKPDNSPDSAATNKAHLVALAKDIAAKGLANRTWIALHHEPYPELSASAFASMYQAYAPSVRAAGVRCGVIYQIYPEYHSEKNYVADYTNGILPIVDFIGIDVYPDASIGDYGSDILQDISPFTSYAKAHGKHFQIDEIAIDSKMKSTGAQAAAWLGGLEQLGADIDAIMYFEATPGSYTNLKIENDPQAVTTWKSLYASLTTR